MAFDGLKDKSPGLHKFLTRHDKPYPFVREILVGAILILLLLGGLYAITGQPVKGGYPVVVVTSGSMMHCTNSGMADTSLGRNCDPTTYGRLAAIDPGDLVFVRHVRVTGDVATFAQNGSNHYGRPGDVVVYRPNGSHAVTPIIHRALFWLQYENDGTFSIEALGISHATSFNQKAITDLTHCVLPSASSPHASAPAESGFITRGDNNDQADQCQDWRLSHPVQMDWVLGKSRGELPWVGLIKLLVDDTTAHTNNFHNAGSDSKTMLVVALVVIIGLPWAMDLRRKRKARQSGE